MAAASPSNSPITGTGGDCVYPELETLRGPVMKETSQSPLTDTIRRRMKNRLRSLEEKYNLIKETEKSQAQGKPLNEEQKALLLSKKRTHVLLLLLKDLLGNQRESAEPHVCSIQRMPRLNESGRMINPDVPGNKERYLCICDGFAIYCLDLMAQKDEYPNQLPIVHTLAFLEKGLPVTAGLLKYGSDTYVVCGEEFPGLEGEELQGLKELKGLERTTHLYWKYGLRGSSRKICHLSFKDEGLSLNICNNLPLLKKPKFFPIVEVIDGEIHVIESIPRLGHYYIYPQTIPSHEVLDIARPDLGWRKIPPIYYPRDHRCVFIREHLVVGKRLFAMDSGRHKFMVFEPGMGKWVLPPLDESREYVGYDFSLGNHLCVGEFRTRGEEEIYMVLGVGLGRRNVHDIGMELLTKAYLVDQNGKICGFQNIRSLFDGAPEDVCSPVDYATLFKVDERTVCIVAIGYTEWAAAAPPEKYVYIWTVTVDQEYESLPRCEGEECVFMKFDVKNMHFYKVGSELWSSEHNLEPYPPQLSACFI